MDSSQHSGFVSAKSNIIYFACFCAFLCVITTIGIHSSLFDFGSLDYTQRAQLSESNWYSFSKWWVIIHCLLVLFSMWGILLLLGRKKIHLTSIGFLSFAVFSFTEIFRQLLALFYLNGLRQKYLSAVDEQAKLLISNSIDSFSLFAYAMFGLFILAFALGNLFYGLSLYKGGKWDKILGYMLLIWAVQGFIVLGNEFWQVGIISTIVGGFSLVFQPLVRLIVGVWIWKKISSE